MAKITAPMAGLSYYWSASQSEYATDVLFDQAAQLQKLYPKFIRHASNPSGLDGRSARRRRI